MPRFPRSFIKTSYFHVMTQGIEKQYIFNTPEDTKYYIKLLKESTKEYKVKVISYCIMNNHAHLLINADEVKELSKYMQIVNTKYGMYYNKKYNRVGYVFRDRYKAEGIYSRGQLYNCMKYIYDNPVKAGLCKKPEYYKYSNYKNTIVVDDEEYVFIDDKDIYISNCKRAIESFKEENRDRY